jgi:23S rRNA pseudouridine1911/1915/1917 synthase
VETGSPRRLELLVGEDEAGQRLDQALAALAGVTRAQARRWIDEQRVRLAGRAPRPAERVEEGERIEAEPPEPVPLAVAAEAIPLAVLFEDADVIVLDKPAGLVVHPAPGHPGGTLVNALLHHCGDLSGIGGVLRPGIVHRLDRGTSGVLVAAKTDLAHASLAAQFHDHAVERVYLALVRGAPAADAGRVERPIGRHPRDRKRMTTGGAAGRRAATAWRVRERFAAHGCALLELRPETGRTHQIRVHLASVGLPIVGDPVYGRARVGAPPLSRPALHAAVLGFEHPRSGARLHFEAPLPEDLRALLARLAEPAAAGRGGPP